jgi:hypothetical protein
MRNTLIVLLSVLGSVGASSYVGAQEQDSNTSPVTQGDVQNRRRPFPRHDVRHGYIAESPRH